MGCLHGCDLMEGHNKYSIKQLLYDGFNIFNKKGGKNLFQQTVPIET